MSTLGLYTTVTCRWAWVRQLVEAGLLPQLIHAVLHPFGF
ncbi:hypothetical protein LCGC14_0826370 [marine sediment metagenome]|uniref:GST N-terminal domain-containing protein n=1 Tax=marine sediment metagenome TaxID=412755 RepID=A0A0F9PM00_9ZZZZ